MNPQDLIEALIAIGEADEAPEPQVLDDFLAALEQLAPSFTAAEAQSVDTALTACISRLQEKKDHIAKELSSLSGRNKAVRSYSDVPTGAALRGHRVSKDA